MKKGTIKLTRIIAVATVILGITWSCQTDETENLIIEESDLSSEGLVETKLGRKLENPYSVTNMKKAYKSLFEKSNGRIASDFEIEATHFYVKFLPKSIEEKNILEADSLELFAHPLDYELDSLGDYYLEDDMSYEDGQWFWTAVPVDYEFPNVEHELLEELFLTHEIEEDTVSNGRTLSSSFLDALEDEALKITGNWTEPDEESSSNSRRKKIRPRGTLRVRNQITGNFEGIDGVKVRTYRFFHWGSDHTDSNGYYSINTRYRRDVRYSIRFENHRGFKLWNTLFDLDGYRYKRDGHKLRSRSGWSEDFEPHRKAWRFATVNNAVVAYLGHCDALGVGRPHSNLRIATLDRGGSSAAPMLRRTWGLQGFTTNSQLANFFLKANKLSIAANKIAIITKYAQPDLVIAARNSRGTANIYATVFHELAHASHMRRAGNSYWVRYINYIITYGAYGDGTGRNAGYCGIGEMWGNYFSAVCMNRERPLGRGSSDYLDELEDWYNPGFLQDVDNIPDVTTAEIFSSLRSSTTSFGRLINELKNRTSNDAQVDNAFANYTDWP